MDEHKKILAAMAEMNEPCGCKEIAEATGMDSKTVTNRLKNLKTEGYIDSPARCRYAITEQGKALL
jgi:predicted transcriptional regulator